MKPKKVTTRCIFLAQFFFILLFLPCCATAACDQVDREALLSLVLKISTPLNWSASSDCCIWEGILCGPNDRVIHLWLPERGLSGFISPTITNLTYLTHLNLSHNFLFGPLPDNLFSSLFGLQLLDLSFNSLKGHLTISSNETSKLEIINFSSNFFDGTIPSSIFMPSVASGYLSIFNVSNNSFAGPIPVSLLCKNGSNHNHLTYLDLSYNNFSGPILAGLGHCSKLQVFRAGYNALSGHLPGDIFEATDLQELSLPVNSLSGPIDDGITRLTNLKILILYSNQFWGPIPSQIGKLTRLEKLVLQVNFLTGYLPPSLINCTNLYGLKLRVNRLTGDLSAFNFSTFQRLAVLDLGNNNFTGDFPQSLYSCKLLTTIRLASNKLTGQILPEIVGLESLSFLSISNNKLTNATGALRNLRGCKNLTTLDLRKSFMLEPMPDDENLAGDGFQNLQLLSLGGCKFEGQLPTWLSKLKNLRVLDLSFNLIFGSIPTWFSTLPNLFFMDLSNNLLTGGFPKELCQMPGLTSKEPRDSPDEIYLEFPVFLNPNNGSDQQYNHIHNIPPSIYLANNSLSGRVPIEIGKLQFILVLDLSHNSFSGSIPDQISNLSNLEKLDLSYNNLSGEIPASLNGLHFLSSFSVAYNDLQGQVPSGGQFSTFSDSSFEGNPGLCGPPTMQRLCLQRPQSPEAEFQSTSNHLSETQKIFIALVFGIFFGIGFSIGFSIDDAKIIGCCRKKLV